MSQHDYPERAAWRRGGGKPCAGAPATIEVLVETLTGSAFEMTVSPLDTVLAIKSRIFRVEGIPISQQHLLYRLKELDNATSLQEHSITDGATLRLVLSMRGGPISMHRLPLPGADASWREIKDLVDTDHEERAWSGGGGGGGGARGKVTVLLFRDGDNVSMVRVVENEDGTYSPLQHANSAGGESGLARDDGDAGPAHDNAVTANKMQELRRRMTRLYLPAHADKLAESPSMQKTRSEELLPSASTLPEPPRRYTGRAGRDALLAAIAPRRPSHHTLLEGERDGSPRRRRDCETLRALLETDYARHDYECSFADRYTLLPPISADSELSSGEDESLPLSERLKLPDALSESILVARCAAPEDALLEAEPRLSKLTAVCEAECGPLVGGEVSTWRVRRTFGSSSQLAPPSPLAPAHSASSLQLRPPLHPPPPLPLPLADGLLSSSTSDLEKLKRNRLLPTLCRSRNRENLDLSDERLDRPPATHCLEVGSERRHRRIKKIAELQRAEATAFSLDDGYESSIRKLPNDAGADRTCPRRRSPHPDDTPPPSKTDKKVTKVRCGLCKKRLNIATVHRCRCGGEYCAPHRYAEVHGCAYDYKAHAHQYLQRANPLVSAPKLPKI